MAVTVKAFIENNGSDKPEIRRFPLSEVEANEFNALREKLANLLEGSLAKGFAVVWKDTEGDEITVSSDEELKLAVASANEGIVRLHIRNSDPRGQPQHPSPVQDSLHPSVTCDGCDTTIRGFRYKCSQCPDFDLCANCEAEGRHSEHVMVRLPTSDSSRQGYTPFHRCHEESSSGQLPPDLHGMKEMFDRLATILEVPQFQSEDQNQASGGSEQRKSSTDKPHDEWEHIHGLRDLFSRLCAANLHAESQNQSETCAEGCDSSSSQHQKPLLGLEDLFQRLLSDLGGAPSSSGHHHADHLCGLNDLLGRLCPELSAAVCATEGQAQGASNTSQENHENADRNSGPSPGDPFSSIREILAAVLPPSNHTEKPNIAEATNSLIGMGFHNEQGWLTKLLELKHGNVNDVLDIIRDLNSYAGENTESIPQIFLSVFDAYPNNPQKILSALQSMKATEPTQHFGNARQKIPIVVT